MILVGRTLTTDDETFGVAIFEASSEAEARQVLADDPAVREGVMQGAPSFPFASRWSAQPKPTLGLRRH
jgi:hypothetical protein